MESIPESDDTDDEVEQEFDVFLSKRLQGKLYLLQYPVKKHGHPFGPTERISAKIKPNNNKLEMDVSLNVNSPSYDQSKGEQISVNVDGNDGASQSAAMFDTNMMDKQVLYSTSIPSTGKRYVCGVLHEGDIHLTPISQVLQLRPSFKYMDQAEHRALRAAKAKEAAEADSSQDEADDAKAVTLRIKGAETEAARLAKERSYAAYEKRLADEKWCPLKFYSTEHSVVELERRKLLCQNTIAQGSMMERGFPDVTRSPREYLDTLKPVYSKHAVDDSAMPENVLSLSLLKNQSLGDQIKLIVKNAKIITFSHLMLLLPSNPDQKIVVRSLQSYASLIRGCWIVKSEILFPPETVSPISGTPAESLCRSRDYILYLFTLKEFLARKEVTAAVKIPSDDVKAILDDIAVLRAGHGWKLRLNPDGDFINSFPEVAERQNMIWNAMGAKLGRQMGMGALSTDTAAVVSNKTDGTPSRKKRTVSGDEKTKPSKSTKRQRKPSGSIPASSVTEIKQEYPSESVPSLPFVQLNGGNSNPIVVQNGELLAPIATMLSPVRTTVSVVPELGSLAEDINIENVNSTVQSIADEIYRTKSPNRAIIPQVGSSTHAAPSGATFYVKQEKET